MRGCKKHTVAPEASITVDGRTYAVPQEVAETFLAVSLERDDLKQQVQERGLTLKILWKHIRKKCRKYPVEWYEWFDDKGNAL